MLIVPPSFSEGVQLLCLIDKGQDSCRYLQTYGEWYHSVWLAKVTQKERDCNETFARWAEHLASSGVSQKVGLELVISNIMYFSLRIWLF